MISKATRPPSALALGSIEPRERDREHLHEHQVARMR
jgi:hypothetical protein